MFQTGVSLDLQNTALEQDKNGALVCEEEGRMDGWMDGWMEVYLSLSEG